MASPQRKLFLIPCYASKKPGGRSPHAAKPLLKNGLIDKAIQYHVIKGNSWLTPTAQGKLLEKYLKKGMTDKLPETIKACAL